MTKTTHVSNVKKKLTMEYTNKNPLKIVVFFSGGASGIKYLKQTDLRFGGRYKIVGAITDKKVHSKSGQEFFESIGIDPFVVSYKTFCDQYEVPTDETKMREKYFEKIHSILKSLNFDLIVFSGFMLLVPERFAKFYKGRIINIHPADLEILIPDTNNRKYIGKGHDVVQMVLNDKKMEVRSSIHFVDENTDHGPLICRSEPMNIQGTETADEILLRMKDTCDGPALMKALKMFCDGIVPIGE